MRDTGRFVLRQLTVAELHAILGSGALPCGGRVYPGALPPRFVIERALARISAGACSQWWTPFIIEDRDGSALGGCAFKGPPEHGRVEVLYGTSKACRGRGVASAAVAQLAAIAFARGAREVLAEIEPRNLGSIRVAQRCGFRCSSQRTAEDGVLVQQWLLAAA